jgi:Tol biopolymer transport system component
MSSTQVRPLRRALVTVLLTTATAVAAPSPAAAAVTTERVSVNTTGAVGATHSRFASASPDGRYVVFRSAAVLVPGDTNNNSDVYLRDRATQRTERVSSTAAGVAGDAKSGIGKLSVSADGRYVAFDSFATDLVPGDTNQAADIFVRDRVAGRTERVSLGTDGTPGNGPSFNAAISPDGRYVAFDSEASNLVGGDTNGVRDVFLRDLVGGATTRVSLDAAGQQATDPSFGPSVSADGRAVAFNSYAALVPGDANTSPDVYVHDRAGRTAWVSVNTSGAGFVFGGSADYLGGSTISADGRLVVFDASISAGPAMTRQAFVRDVDARTSTLVSVNDGRVMADSMSNRPTISPNGRYVAFESFGVNLVPGDTNRLPDIFRRDLATGKTVRANVSTAGTQANYQSFAAVATDAGVAFESGASTLVPGGRLGNFCIFFRSV